MQTQAKPTLEDRLETLVDIHGLGQVLMGLTQVCRLKAEHLRTNWQDEITADSWEEQGEAIEQLVRDYF